MPGDEAEASVMAVDESGLKNQFLELTRNPFDSNLYERDNFPVLDSSVFQMTATPQRESNEFRWSIDQIAKIKPTVMDLNPNQEYSVVYSTQEDEERSQRQVDEYFKSVLLPSPWLENHSNVLKRVTFSPDFPTTHYINEATDQKINKNNDNKEVQLEETLLSDACCQTELTFSMDFDLQILLGKDFYSYYDESGEARALMISSLRRKLFVQEIKTPLKSNICSPYTTAANYTTSSPTKEHLEVSCTHRNRPITPGEQDASSVSPISSYTFASLHTVFESPAKVTPPQIAAVCTPLRHCGDISLSNVSMSPIRSSEKLSSDISDYSFLPDVSLDFNASGTDIRESSRAVQIQYPDISPIKNEVASNPATEMFFMQESCQSELQMSSQQSIKESTARNIHAFGGFDISSISECSTKLFSKKEGHQGSLDESVDMNISKGSDEDEPEILHITDLSIDESQVAGGFPHLLPTFNVSQHNSDEFVSPKIVTLDNHESMTTPLKGILKHRDLITPKRTNLRDFDSLDSTQYNTVYNSGSRKKAAALFTRASSSISLPSSVLNDKMNLPKPKLPLLNDFWEDQNELNTPVRHSEHRHDESKVIISGVNRQCLRDITVGNVERPVYDRRLRDYNSPIDFSLNNDVVCLRANTALKRAYEVSKSLHMEDKENYCAINFQNTIKLNNSTICSDSPILKPIEKKFAGIVSKDIDSLSKDIFCIKKSNDDESSATSPFLSLDKLSISSNSNTHTSGPKKSLRVSAQRRSSGLMHRSYSWPYKSRANSPFFSPDTNVTSESGNTPNSSRVSANRSRVLPKYRDRSPNFRGEELFDPMKSAYKDFLPSPLK